MPSTQALLCALIGVAAATPYPRSVTLPEGLGIAWSAYNKDTSSSLGTSCKTLSQVKQELGSLTGYDYVRTYGTDCDQIANILSGTGLKIFVGIQSPQDASTEVQRLVSAVNGNWGRINTVSVGNEGLNTSNRPGSYSLAQLKSGMSTARSALKNAGYTGPVVNVDDFATMIQNPQLCEISDYAAANCYAFFDSNEVASNAGSYAKTQAANVKSACGNKPVIITESGWPWKGNANGNAKPSIANQNTAVSSLKSSFSSGGLVLFEATDDLWKPAGEYDVERYWGIYSHAT